MAARGKSGKRRSWFRIITGTLMALVCAVLLYQFWLFGLVVWYNYQNPGSSAVMREELSRLQDGNPDFRLNYEWVPYDKINRSLKLAVVASEDSNFTEHDGVEWDAIRSADVEVVIRGVTGNVAANGTHRIQVIDAFSFALVGTVGDGEYALLSLMRVSQR